jgi:hypothetical protein
MNGRMIGAHRIIECQVGLRFEHNNHFDIYTQSQCLACVEDKRIWYYGFLFNLTSWWIGVHYSRRERRVCINLVPMLTIWFTLRGGQAP